MQSQIPVMDYEGSQWREEFWRGREYEDRVERIALAAMLPPHGTRLIEIGAGFGRLADLYRGYEQVVLLDYARSMLKDARERLGDDPRFSFVAADLYDLPFADSAFDTALTVRVLHHVADIPRAFAEVSRIVRSRGTYITDFANKRHIKAILKYYLGVLRLRSMTSRSAQPSGGTAPEDVPNGQSPFSLEPYEFVKLNFDYHPSYISQNLLRNWFAVRDERAVSTFRVGALKRTVPTALLVTLDRMLQSPISSLSLSPSIFLRAESEKPGAPKINPALWRCLNCHSTEMGEQGAGLLEPSGLLQAGGLRCNNCHRFYPRVDGVYDFKSAS